MKHFIIFTIASFTMIFLSACNRGYICGYNADDNTLTCSDKIYKTINYNGTIWITENLIRPDLGGNSFCYNEFSENCTLYGSLYPFNIANRICPVGWKLPSQKDFESINISDPNFKTKKVGFRYYDGKYVDENISARFWTSDSFDEARGTMLVYDTSVTFEHFNKSIAASVRCIKE